MYDAFYWKTVIIYYLVILLKHKDSVCVAQFAYCLANEIGVAVLLSLFKFLMFMIWVTCLTLFPPFISQLSQ